VITKQQTGRSFKSASEYLLHDKGARTSERVEWVHLENCDTTNAARAYKEMAFSAMHAQDLKEQAGGSRQGRKQEKPSFHLSLSWAKDEEPDRAEMIGAGQSVLQRLGLEKHQTLFVCHNDQEHRHIHLLVNRVDPETGKMNTLSHSKRSLSSWAMEYEFNQGKIRCEKRVENNRALEQGKKPRHRDAVIQDAWERSDSGRAFQAALAERGYVLARGNKRVVVMDPHGKAINPARQLYGVKAADIKARLSDLDLTRLPDVEQAKQRQQEGRQDDPKQQQERKQGEKKAVGKEKEPDQVYDRDRHNQDWEKSIIEAAIAKEESRAGREAFNRKAKSPKRRARSKPAKEPETRPPGETQRESKTGEDRERSALAQEFQRSLSRIAEASRQQRQRLAEGSRRTLQAAASRIRRLGSFADQLDAQREAEAKAQAEADRKEKIFGQQRRNIEETLKHRPPADKQERKRLEDALRDEDKRRSQPREPPSPAPGSQGPPVQEKRSRSVEAFRKAIGERSRPDTPDSSPANDDHKSKVEDFREKMRERRSRDRGKDRGPSRER